VGSRGNLPFPIPNSLLPFFGGANLVWRSSEGFFPHVTRPMEPADREIVRQIDRDAFERLRRNELPGRLSLRTAENIDAAFERPYPGVVLEAPRGQVVGYCFTHVWGSLGWLGTLGIAPVRQGIGLGRPLVAAGLRLLEEAGCSALALETMPESGRNLALYTRLGLEPRRLTLLFEASPPAARTTHWAIWRDESDDLRAVASALVPGLDPTPAARWLLHEESGDTLVWRDAAGEPVCFAVLRHAPRRQGSLQAYLTVEAAACLPRVADEWPRFLAEMQAYAEGRGRAGLVLPVNADQTALLGSALDAGMRIVQTRVRMVRGGALGGPDDLLMLTLAM